MTQQRPKPIHADVPFADVPMTVYAATERAQGVIGMQQPNSLPSDRFSDFLCQRRNALGCPQFVTRRKKVTSVKANADEFAGQVAYRCRQLLQPSTQATSLTRRVFQKEGDGR